jgi:Fe2+ transport system protein FeoA
MAASARTLDQLRPGETAVGGSGPLRRRLLDMGLVRGAAITMIKTAPLGDPVQYRVRGYHLALRRAEAHTITLEA